MCNGLLQKLSKIFLVIYVCYVDEQFQYFEVDEIGVQYNVVGMVFEFLGEDQENEGGLKQVCFEVVIYEVQFGIYYYDMLDYLWLYLVSGFG